MADEVSLVLRFAFISRLLVLILQVIFNFLVADYDSSSTIGKNSTQFLDRAVTLLFDGFQKWDSVYFLQIAQHGYQYEQYMAFFPLFPWLINTISSPVHVFSGEFLAFSSLVLLVGWLLSSVCFCVATALLYKLSFLVLKNKRLAFNSCLLFCINPASIFMSTVYTESLFVCCLFCGLYFLEKPNCLTVNIMLASVAFSLGCGSRSNGIVSCGFVAHFLLKTFISENFIRIFPSSKLKTSLKSGVLALMIIVFKLVISILIILCPFVAFQFHGYMLICKTSEDLQTELPTPPWCSWKLPLIYSYIQDHYWHVGFLKYFEFKQIPNFILALPIVILSLMAILEFFSKTRNRLTVWTLGLWIIKTDKQSIEAKQDTTYQDTDLNPKHLDNSNGFYSPGVFVYIAHLAFLTVFGVTSIHVQVLTRLISSSSPVIYWYLSHLLTTKHYKDTKQANSGSLVLGYFITYFCIGIILHCNFYPWT